MSFLKRLFKINMFKINISTEVYKIAVTVLFFVVLYSVLYGFYHMVSNDVVVTGNTHALSNILIPR